MSIRRMMLFTLGRFFKSIISLFKTKVLSDGGNFEAETNLENQLNNLGSTLFDSASLVITPNGVKTSKLYTIKPNDGTGDLSVVRNTSGTRINENGLIEIPATNLVLRSEEFNDDYWLKANTVITPNQTLSPINTLTADLISESNTTNNLFYLYSLSPLISVQQGIWYTASVYVKKGIGITAPDIIQMTFNGNRFGSLQYANFNIVNGTVTYSQNGNASIKALADGWFRISWTASATSTGADNFIPIIFCNNNPTSLRAPLYNGKNTSDIFIWGAQVEQGMTATEYIPTTSVIRTRFAGITQDGGSASNIPRIDYTAGSPAILVEPQRTNLVLYSEQFNNGYWDKMASSISQNTTTSPDNTNNASTYLQNATGYPRLTSPIFTFNANTDYTLSVYIKNIDAVRFSVVMLSDLSNFSWFNLQTYSLESVSGSMSEARITNIGNGWYRVTTKIRYTTTTSSAFYFRLSTSGSPNSVDFSKSVYIWGAQLEAGSNVTSYIPTVSGSVTRNADSISKNGIIDLIGQTEGSIFCEFERTTETAGRKHLFTLSGDGYTTNSLFLGSSTNAVNLVLSVYINSTPYQSNLNILLGKNKVLLIYDTTGCDIFLNGTKLTRLSLPSFPSLYNLNLLQYGSTRQYGSAYIFSFWKTKLSDQQAIQLTTL